MEPINNLPVIRCSLHPSEAIQRVDLDFNSQKQLYCVECMLRTDNSKSAYSHLVSIQDFISKAAISYLNSKHKVRHISDPPAEYLEILGRQGETMDKLTKHINEEKAKVEDVFTEITKDVLKVLESKKNEYLNTLDEQILNLTNHYDFFEKQLKRGYFKPEDASSLFPTKEELNTQLSKIVNSAQLSTFIKSIKEDLNQDKCGVNFLDAADENIKAYLDSLVENLNELESITPVFENQKLDIHQIIAEVKSTVDNLFEQAFILRNPILNVPSAQTYPESSILKADDFKLIRTWLPSKFSFSPRLLYRASRDGMSPEPFHSKCDGKGPTITVIKCEFSGSAKSSIIGGFLDKDWHKKQADILSNDAFLFSITTRVRCPIQQPQYAAHGRGDSGPVFGGGCDILVTRDLAQCYVNPLSYSNAASIVESEKYAGSGSIKFTPLDMEVYALK